MASARHEDRDGGLGPDSLDLVLGGEVALPSDAGSVRDVSARWERPPRLRPQRATFPSPYLEGLLRLTVVYSPRDGSAARCFEGLVEVLRFLEPDSVVARTVLAPHATAAPRDVPTGSLTWGVEEGSRVSFQVRDSSVLTPAAASDAAEAGRDGAEAPQPVTEAAAREAARPVAQSAAQPRAEFEAEVRLPVWSRECTVSRTVRTRLPTPLGTIADVRAEAADVRVLRVGRKLEVRCRLDVALEPDVVSARAPSQPLSVELGVLVPERPGTRIPEGAPTGSARVAAVVARLADHGRELWLQVTLNVSVSVCEARRIRLQAPVAGAVDLPEVLIARPSGPPPAPPRAGAGHASTTVGVPHTIDVLGTSPRLRLLGPAKREQRTRGTTRRTGGTTRRPASRLSSDLSDLASSVAPMVIDVMPLQLASGDLPTAEPDQVQVPADVVLVRRELPLLLHETLELPADAVKIVDSWITLSGAWVRRSAGGVVVGGTVGAGVVCACSDAVERTATSTTPIVVRLGPDLPQGERAGSHPSPAAVDAWDMPSVEASARIRVESPEVTPLSGSGDGPHAPRVSVAAPAVVEVILTALSHLAFDRSGSAVRPAGASAPKGPASDVSQGKATRQASLNLQLPGGVATVEGLDVDVREVRAEAVAGAVRVTTVVDAVVCYTSPDGLWRSARRSISEQTDVRVLGAEAGARCGASAVVKPLSLCLVRGDQGAAPQPEAAAIDLAVEIRAWSRAGPQRDTKIP